MTYLSELFYQMVFPVVTETSTLYVFTLCEYLIDGCRGTEHGVGIQSSEVECEVRPSTV